MFDLDAGKLLIIAIVALVVIPPKDLPSVMRQLGQALGKMRRMAADFQSQFMDAIHDAELDGIRNDVRKLSDDTKLDVDFDPVAAIRDELEGALGEGPIGASTLATVPASTRNVIGTGDLESHPLSTETASPDLPAAKTVAAHAAPAQSGEATGVIPHIAAGTAATEPAVSEPGESVETGQEADARRS